MSPETIIHLSKAQFETQETLLVQYGELSASGFRFPSGVEAVRLTNSRGELILLPFQGQQIWRASFDGRELGMRSMFEQPYPTRDFLATYGAFLVHCGATAMGVPGPQDTHPLHGELPNAPYQSARLVVGEDEGGPYLALTGSYRHQVFFNYDYIAQPVTSLYVASTVFDVSLTVTNLKRSPMPLMYLAHINFRPEDNARLYYTADVTPEHVRVRASFPPFMQVDPKFRQFAEALRETPEKHHVFEPGLAYDPELVFFIDYLADEYGWAHTLQIHPDGSGDVMRHRPAQLKRALRWISRTPDQDALGFEPATAEGNGFTAEKEKGNLEYLAPGQTFHCDMQMGYLTPEEAEAERDAIEAILA